MTEEEEEEKKKKKKEKQKKKKNRRKTNRERHRQAHHQQDGIRQPTDSNGHNLVPSNTIVIHTPVSPGVPYANGKPLGPISKLSSVLHYVIRDPKDY